MITISDAARDYLADLLAKQDAEGIGVRMFVTQGGTPYAETCLAYCRLEERVDTDEVHDMGVFPVYLDRSSLPYLEAATIDYDKDRAGGGQLTIKAPNAKMKQVSDDSPIEDKINYILYTEVNPGLASHGGEVSLVEVTDDNVAVLKFGGGCQGCSAVDMTLKDGVERTLVAEIPELTGVADVTDHSIRDNAYYK